MWYRIRKPMELLNSNGVKTQSVLIGQDIDIGRFHTFMTYGATPFSMIPALKKLKEEYGKRIVYDMDDALSLIDISNFNYYEVKKSINSVHKMLEYADYVTVSTPEMERYVRTLTGLPIKVIPNCYSEFEWTYPRPKREGIRIGYTGSATHVPDLINILPAIKNIQQKNKDVKFLIQGFGNPDYPTFYDQYRYACPIEGIEALKTMDRMLSEIQFEWVPEVEYMNYPSTLINMSLDIGLCPLSGTPFNRCRSACKAMEYTLSGALAIASDIEPYRFDQSSVLVKDDEWESTIEYYITHSEERDLKRREHLAWLIENRNIDTKLDLLKSVYHT